MTWDELIAEINTFRAYEDDWDSFGSSRPADSTIDKAIEFAKAMQAIGCPPAHRVTATVNSEISFEYHGENYVQCDVVDGKAMDFVVVVRAI